MVSCRGYLPPEYIESNLISKKFDIFSLGVVIIKIITGPTGHSRSSDMSPQQFIENVRKCCLSLSFKTKLLWKITWQSWQNITIVFPMNIGTWKLEEKATGNANVHAWVILQTSEEMHRNSLELYGNWPKEKAEHRGCCPEAEWDRDGLGLINLLSLHRLRLQ